MKLQKKCFYVAWCAVMLLTGCTPYERQDGCALDKLNIKGNVTKIETVVQSTIPLTELYYGSVKPSEAFSMYAANLSIDVNKHGNIDELTAYGIDGELMLVVDNYNPEDDSKCLLSIVGAAANQEIDDVKISTDANGKISEASFYSNGNLIWTQQMSYNDKGDVCLIVKDYVTMGVDYCDVAYKDSTVYEYIDYDSHGNWTKVSVEYIGMLPKHHHVYTVLRQMTYDGEAKPAPLLGKLRTINNVHKYQSENLVKIPLGYYGSMEIPSYMTKVSDDYMSSIKSTIPNNPGLEYLFVSEYDQDDAYAQISVTRVYEGNDGGFDNWSSQELIYDKEVDNYLKEMFTSQLALGQTYILKWLPYEFTTISGDDEVATSSEKRALRIRYYRYGKGSPIPVFYESYTVQMDDGYSITISYSYQSSMEDKFRDDFMRVIKSVSFY